LSFWAKSFVRFAKRLLGSACPNDRIHRLVPMDPRLSYQRFHLQPPYGPRCLRGPHPPRAGATCALAAFATVLPEAMGIANTMSGKTRQQIGEAMSSI
jgi:hypothetical protein